MIYQVHCHVGSLEKYNFSCGLNNNVHCHVGSLEIFLAIDT